MGINYRRLVQLHEQRSPAEAKADVRHLFEDRELKPQDIDLGRLFVECFGWENFVACRNREQLVGEVMERALTEAQGAVSTDAFNNVSGQFVYQTVLDAYTAEEFVFTPLIPEVQASTLDGEKIPGITEIGDEAGLRHETDPYPLAGVGEDWVFTPAIKDRGFIVPVTWEAIFNDKTGRLIERASAVGRWMGVNVEKRAIDAVIDENRTDHRYNWRGTVIASYGDNSGNHTWDNLVASNALVDWTDVDTAEQAYNDLVDPYTGEPITFDPVHLVTTKSLSQTALRILSATEIRVNVGGYATTGNLSSTTQPNPYAGKYTPVSSRLLAARLATDTSWFLGNIGMYAKRMVAEPINTVQAPPNNHDEFHRRIVRQFRVNERSAFVVVQPRAMVKNTA